MNEKRDETDLDVYATAATIGAVAGLRCLTAPALLGYFASRENAGELKNNLLSSPKVAAVVGALAIGELIGDKLPSTPNRTEPTGLIARIVSGAFVGGSICAARKKNVLTGAALGAVAAVAAAYAGQNIRREICDETGIPTAALGAVEDGIAISVGINALKNF